MMYDILYLLKDLVIVVLIFAVIGLARKIRKLQKTLTEEQYKRSMPLLTLEVTTADDRGAFLVNTSYCYARNIRIDDLDVVVDYGFKKHLILKFDPLEMLRPNGRGKLKFRVFDGKYDATTSDAGNILNHFSDAPIRMQLHYENLEGIPFTSTILPENGQYVIKDAALIQEKSR